MFLSMYKHKKCFYDKYIPGMEEMDLDINNYNLNDLLNLYNLDIHFSEQDLKSAYKVTLMTHPDKSNMDKKYFLFFCKAFKLIKQVYDVTHKSQSCVSRDNYDKVREYYSHEKDKKDKLKNILEKHKDKQQFNKWFNDLFDSVNNKEDTSGYGEWLKSNKDLEDNTEVFNLRDMNSVMEERKKKASSLIIHKGVEEQYSCTNGNTSNLIDSQIESYESSMFSKLQYNDVKKAHNEGLIPVCEDDFRRRPQYNSVTEYEFARSKNMQVPSEEQASQYLKRKKLDDDKQNLQNAFELSKQMEKHKEQEKKWWSKILQIEDKRETHN